MFHLQSITITLSVLTVQNASVRVSMNHLFSVACLVAALTGTEASASPVTISIDPSPVTQGQSVTVTLSGVVDPVDTVGAFTFNLSFANSLSFVPNSLALGSILNMWDVTSVAGQGSLGISIADYPTDVALPDSAGQSVTLFSLQLSTSNAAQGLQSVQIAPDPNDSGVVGAYQFSTSIGSFSVARSAPPAAVPAPGALAVLPALLLLLMSRRRA